MNRTITIFALLIAFFAIQSRVATASSGAFEHVRGRVLIDVERHGQAWYVHPVSGKRYYLNSPSNALSVMRELSLGISEDNLVRIPTSSHDFDLPEDLAHVAGRILLNVNQGGEAWYVYPEDGRRYRLGNPGEALNVMANLGLGITHDELAQIPPASFLNHNIYFNVPFVSQAPFAEWDDRRQHEGCEEATAFMAVRWARGQDIERAEAREQIISASRYEESQLGFYEDTSVQDTARYILKDYFGFSNYRVRKGVSVTDIIKEMRDGRVVIIGVEGRELGNPNFPGIKPFRHMLLVIGYDSERDMFITHDPGTRNGENYRYSPETLSHALLDYPSGYREPVMPNRTGLIAVWR